MYPPSSFPYLLGPPGFSPASLNTQSSAWKDCVVSKLPYKLAGSEYFSGLANSVYEKLTVEDCIRTYDPIFLKHNGFLLFLSNEMTNYGGDLLNLYDGSVLTSEKVRPNRTRILGLPPITRSYTVRDTHGRMTSGTNATKTACFRTYTEEDSCSDYSTLDLIMRLEPQNLDAALHNPALWKNSSWATEVDIRQGPVTCADVPDTLLIDDTLAQGAALADPDYFLKYTYSFDGCLSMRTKEHCRLLVNPPICVIVIVCCAIKAVCAFLTSRTQREELLLTTGDAIASFLSHPDDHGIDQECLALCRRNNICRRILRKNRQGQEKLPPKTLHLRRQRWFNAVSVQRWLISMSLYVAIPDILSGHLLTW